MVLEHINLLKSAHLMSSVQICFTSKEFSRCQKVFISGTLKAVRINPLKNIHFL